MQAKYDAGDYGGFTHPAMIKGIPHLIERMKDYAEKGIVPEGGHCPVRLWIMEAPYTPLNDWLEPSKKI